MDLARLIEYLYPAARNLEDFVVTDEGAGPAITTWSEALGPPPDAAHLEEVAQTTAFLDWQRARNNPPEWAAFAAAMNASVVAARLALFGHPAGWSMMLAQLASFHHEATLLAAFQMCRSSLPEAQRLTSAEIATLNSQLAAFRFSIRVPEAA